MAKVVKTPGVYIVEKDAFPNPVVEVETAVPAFIGYTEKHRDKEQDIRLRPRRIVSLSEYETYFGGAPVLAGAYDLSTTANTELPAGRDVPMRAGPLSPVVREGEAYFLARVEEKQRRFMYYGMKSFFMNGGGPCYVVSLGETSEGLDQEVYMEGIKSLLTEQEPTMLVFPDAVLMSASSAATVYNAAIDHCEKMQSRITIVDIFRGFNPRSGEGIAEDCITEFREEISASALKNAVAYYPWIDTAVTRPTDKELTYKALSADGQAALTTMLTAELISDDMLPPKKESIERLISGVTDTAQDTQVVHDGLVAESQHYKDVIKAIEEDVNLLPPGATIAGVYAKVDNTRGVWKAPANVGMVGVKKPAVNVTHDEQEDLNVHVTGKSINAIRSFVGEGTLIWGARTLDGNSLDWRYINVRRTLIMLEQSIKLASRAYVFEANDANTWVAIKSLISNFLTGIWKRGGLAGTSPDDAFSVHVGLGETMTPEDLLEGILRITVLVAPSRPAEFIEITFQQQMQKS